MKKPTASPTDTAWSSQINQTKLGHLRVCQDDEVDRGVDSFAQFKLRYNALPELDLDEVSVETEFAGRTIAAPVIISCMTGGVGEPFITINRNLALGAETLGIPLGLGSMKILLYHEDALASYMVRNEAPKVPIIANLGLVSFNYGLEYSDMERIIEMVQPDVFGLHLNALQEVVQEGGDTNFFGLGEKLAELIDRCPLPVYVKECGGGIAPDLVLRLAGYGADYIDISGSDGTSWAAVEGRLSPDASLGELLRDFGLPTSWILRQLKPSQTGRAKIVAGGGIRNGVQAVKALCLGASYVSVARPFLLAASDSADAVVNVGRRIIREMRAVMFLLGAQRLDRLNKSLLIEL